MKNKPISQALAISLSIFIGLFVLGFFIYKGLKTFSDKDRVVTVKGLAEMNMKAISGTIHLSFTYSGDDIKNIINYSEEKKESIITYLKQNGYKNDDVKISNKDIYDRQSYYEMRWNGNNQEQVKVDRYTVTQNLVISSNDVENIENKKAKINLDLISQDLTATITTEYIFPELNTIKPKLIAESTKNARVAGEQFANDSQATLGKIKTASQGQISIVGNYYVDEEQMGANQTAKEPFIQKARVVSSIVFFLE
jgi:hypothetical protein